MLRQLVISFSDCYNKVYDKFEKTIATLVEVLRLIKSSAQKDELIAAYNRLIANLANSYDISNAEVQENLGERDRVSSEKQSSI